VLDRVGGRHFALESTRDITERKTFEGRQELLLRELTHRIKNTLAVVQAIAHQTQRYSHSPEDFIKRFDGRLQALSNAHSLLLGSSWTGADVAAIARSQLDAYRSVDHPNRLRVEGDPVTLPADLATPFGLVLHELATNAVKHGALSAPDGAVMLRWSMTSRNKTPALTVVWSETGGPPVQPPKKSGFGGVLIENGLPQAVVRREFRPEGLVCTMEIPVPEATQDGSSGQT
jgi:two-component system CheB/CheR fusion protein